MGPGGDAGAKGKETISRTELTNNPSSRPRQVQKFNRALRIAAGFRSKRPITLARLKSEGRS